ncbi:MAG: hypothetical protein J0H29_11575 [Sphingobacteriales bacterium]|nr:hypothetical protein [Sphingobacteriales bacterium]
MRRIEKKAVFNQPLKLSLLSVALLVLFFLEGFSQPFQPFQYKIAIIGNPSNPDIRYDSSTLSSLKKHGFNALQLNIAWGARPADEPLNLEDIFYTGEKEDTSGINRRFAAIKNRARIAKKWGFRTIFHFGAPSVDSLYKLLSPEKIDVATATHSIQKKEIADKYRNLLMRLRRSIPEIDDILVYTFDQEAWIGSEFGNDTLARGIPLHERLPAFLNMLTKTWATINPEGRLWWEPWELSAGQIYACIDSLPGSNFGVAMHANIAEVQFTRPVDIWFKNMCNLLTEKNIPVIGEIFMSGANEEVEPLQHIFAPRLVFEELEAMYGVRKLTGIKEYYGTIPDAYDPNLQMAGLKLNIPDLDVKHALDHLAIPYGASKNLVLQAWEATAKGLQLFPWDCSWRFRLLPVGMTGIQVFHRWDIGHISGAVAPSPSWKSTRRGLFMITEEEKLDPWFFEDIELRSAAAADQLLLAIAAYEKLNEALPENTVQKRSIPATILDLQKLEQIMRAIQCYCREVTLANMMRENVQKNIPVPQDLIGRFNAIMKIDIRNQQKGLVENKDKVTTAEEMLGAFNANPAEWVIQHLIIQ